MSIYRFNQQSILADICGGIKVRQQKQCRWAHVEKKKIIILLPVTTAAKENLQAEAWETTGVHLEEAGENCLKVCCYIKHSEAHKHQIEKKILPTETTK